MDSTSRHTAVAVSAQAFMGKVRRYTRRKYSTEDKIRIILEGMGSTGVNIWSGRNYAAVSHFLIGILDSGQDNLLHILAMRNE